MRRFAHVVCATATPFLLISCGSLKVRDRNNEAVNTVKRAAVVAFSVYQPTPTQLSFNLSKGKAEAASGGSLIPKEDMHSEKMLTDLQKSLKENMKWDVVKTDSMKSTPGYTQAYQSTMEGWQNKMPPGQGMQQYQVNGIMDFDGGRILGPQGRDQLIEALNVDAIVVARVDVHLNGTSIMGIGKRHPQSVVTFQIYKKGIEQPIWFDGGVKGQEMDRSVGSTGFFDEKLLSELAVESARTAFLKIGRDVE